MTFEEKKKEYQRLLIEEYKTNHKEETEHLTDEEIALMNPLNEEDITMLMINELNDINKKIVELVSEINHCEAKLNDSKTFYQEKTELRQDKINAQNKLKELKRSFDELKEKIAVRNINERTSR